MWDKLDLFLAEPSLSKETRRAYLAELTEFLRWLEQQGIKLEQVNLRTVGA